MDKDLKKIKFHFQEDIEPHEILLDKLAKRKEEEFGLSEKKFEPPLLKKILSGLLFFSLAILFLLFAKTFQMQILADDKFLALAKENKFIISQLKAQRGVIYDQKSNQLVSNRLGFDLVFNKNNFPKQASEQKKILDEISRILNIKTADLENKILVAENLDHQTLIILKTKIDQLPGFEIENNAVREYKDGPDFAHLLGYKRKTGEKTGLEQIYDAVLAEKPGQILFERDAKGNIISKELSLPPESGKSLVLWLDSDLQEKANLTLQNTLQRIGAKSGAVVALNPKTGGVLALSSLPSFNNNQFSQGMSDKEWQKIIQDPLKPLFNRAIASAQPTGSVIKPLIASAALQEKIISPEKQIYTQGFIEITSSYNPEITFKFEDWKVHGWTDMRKAIAESNNVYFYTIGGGYKSQSGLGPTRIKKYLELFGWGKTTGIDLPGEEQGLIPSPVWKKEAKSEGWWDGDTYHLSIGQGDVLATPLQVAAAFSSIVNGGKLLQPQVVKNVVDDKKNIIEEQPIKIIRENFIAPQNLQIVREGMRQAVTSPDGSSFILNSLPVALAAKTGTAQTGRGDYYNTWVTVFAPYDDPQIVLTIMIENVKGLSQLTVLPAAKEILEWYFTQ